MIRKTLALLAIVALLVVLLPTASAAETITAREFVDTRCATNVFGTLRVVGGDPVEDFGTDCSINLADGASIIFNGVTIRRDPACNVGCGLFIGTSEKDNTIKFVDSTIDIEVLSLSAGTFVSSGGKIVIKGSTITVSYMVARASGFFPGGSIVVRDSDITAYAAYPYDFPPAMAFDTWEDGKTVVKDSSLTSATTVRVRSGPGDSRSVVKRNSFNTTATAVTSGGICRVADNVGPGAPVSC